MNLMAGFGHAPSVIWIVSYSLERLLDLETRRSEPRQFMPAKGGFPSIAGIDLKTATVS